jgi:hypothetical protein
MVRIILIHVDYAHCHNKTISWTKVFILAAAIALTITSIANSLSSSAEPRNVKQLGPPAAAGRCFN